MAATSSDASNDDAADGDRRQAIVERPDGFYWQDLATGREVARRLATGADDPVLDGVLSARVGQAAAVVRDQAGERTVGERARGEDGGDRGENGRRLGKPAGAVFVASHRSFVRADDMDAAQIERRQHVEIEEREIGHVVDPVGRVGKAEARMVGRQHVEMLGQALERGA